MGPVKHINKSLFGHSFSLYSLLKNKKDFLKDRFIFDGTVELLVF
jgi:hypothetical protein|tara:strand:- start:263 stop:397 length:135 start_codon:yes stop_codon:yes gene_type:complete